MKAQNFLNTEIVTSEKRFDAIINSKSFVDFKVIDSQTVIVSLDGKQIRHCNLPSISSRYFFFKEKQQYLIIFNTLNRIFFIKYHISYFVFRTYAISKHSMWQTWAFCSSRMCKFYDANVRMAITDTDSIYSIAECFRSELMHTEIHALQHSPIDYKQSLHAYTMATAYIKTYANILDFSSLKPKVNSKSVSTMNNSHAHFFH